MNAGAKKTLISGVAVIGIAVQIAWAAALIYPLALAVAVITRYPARL